MLHCLSLDYSVIFYHFSYKQRRTRKNYTESPVESRRRVAWVTKYQGRQEREWRASTIRFHNSIAKKTNLIYWEERRNRSHRTNVASRRRNEGWEIENPGAFGIRVNPPPYPLPPMIYEITFESGPSANTSLLLSVIRWLIISIRAFRLRENHVRVSEREHAWTC